MSSNRWSTVAKSRSTSARAAFPSLADFLGAEGRGGRPLVIEATNSPLGFRDAVTAARIGGRVVIAGIPGRGFLYAARGGRAAAGPEVKFVRRMGDAYPRAIAFVTSGRVDVRAVVTHQAPLGEAPALFEALAASRPGYLKALLLPNG